MIIWSNLKIKSVSLRMKKASLLSSWSNLGDGLALVQSLVLSPVLFLVLFQGNRVLPGQDRNTPKRAPSRARIHQTRQRHPLPDLTRDTLQVTRLLRSRRRTFLFPRKQSRKERLLVQWLKHSMQSGDLS